MIKEWLNNFVQQIKENFCEHIVFIGIQGSYARGEATKNSDIDVVVIFDELSYYCIKRYDEIISTMSMRDKICGFISGKRELENWDRADLFQFYYDTTPLYGDLDFIKDMVTTEDVSRAIKTGACNIYHACVHNAVHEKSNDILKALLKSAVFVIQAKYYLDNKYYLKSKQALIDNVCSGDKEIVLLSKEKNLGDLDCVSEKLIKWAAGLICR